MFLGGGALQANHPHPGPDEPSNAAAHVDVRSPDLVVGTATTVDHGSLTLVTTWGDTVEVELAPETEFEDGTAADLQEGVVVGVLGQETTAGTFEATAVFFLGDSQAVIPGQDPLNPGQPPLMPPAPG